jgi:hypothetical protein
MAIKNISSEHRHDLWRYQQSLCKPFDTEHYVDCLENICYKYLKGRKKLMKNITIKHKVKNKYKRAVEKFVKRTDKIDCTKFKISRRVKNEKE